jgi:hypothetical protein
METMRHAPDNQGIIEEIQRAARELGTDRMSRRQFAAMSPTAARQVQRHFDTWTEAVAAAGLTPISTAAIPEDDLFREMAATFLKSGGICARRRFDRACRYSADAYRRRYGSWRGSLAAFRRWLEKTGAEFPFAESLPSVAPCARGPRRREGEAGRMGTRLRRRSRSGPPLGFRGQVFAPTNEQGVVLLFATVFQDLGFVIEEIRTGYPDCEARRRVDGRDDLWEHVTIEFEFRSSGFRRGGHDAEACDLVVCWIDDWRECPVEVLELRTAIQALGR